LLFLIFSIAFIFRVAVIFHNEYPPSSDIGLHSGIINLILDEGKLPIWNPYHMGGEPLATPPGFHLFVSTLILFTGMPLLFAQLITAAFFSAFIVLPAYLISKKIWRSHSTGIIAAFFAAISALSIEMISWGGYTNIISLALIVLIFYLFIRDMEHPSHLNLLIGTLLFGSTILTHTFSLFVFFPILIVYFAFLFTGRLRMLKEIKLQKPLRFFIISVVAGIIVVSPWIVRVLNFYIGASSEGILLGGLAESKNIILANRSIDSIILILVLVLIPTFLIFKSSRKRYIENISLLLVVWFLVPVIMTQSHIFGVYVDYSRFLYFIDFPGILIISASLLYIIRITTAIIKGIPKVSTRQIRKIILPIFAASFFIFIILSPWSIYPGEAIKRVDFYTTIKRPEATALTWVQNNTPESSVLAADHLYGWWLSGVGERPTLSAAGLEFLLYQHEIEVAKSAQLLLDTDFYIDNGLIQVRDDGTQISRHNPEFSIETTTEKSYPLFTIQDHLIAFWYAIEENVTYPIPTLADMNAVEPPLLVKDENSANLTMTLEDDLFVVKKTLTVRRGIRFAELSYNIEVKDPKTNLYNIWFPILTGKGELKINMSIPMFGCYDPNQKVFGQVIFKEDTPSKIEYIDDIDAPPIRARMLFRYPHKRNINIKMLICVFDAEELSYPDEVEETYYRLAASPQETVTQEPLVTWDYRKIIEEYDISCVVCRDPDVYLKFLNPNFRRVFQSGKVTIFQVVK
jgi:hypothetical protein